MSQGGTGHFPSQVKASRCFQPLCFSLETQVSLTQSQSEVTARETAVNSGLNAFSSHPGTMKDPDLSLSGTRKLRSRGGRQFCVLFFFTTKVRGSNSVSQHNSSFPPPSLHYNSNLLLSAGEKRKNKHNDHAPLLPGRDQF